jgi:hypothetical protein
MPHHGGQIRISSAGNVSIQAEGTTFLSTRNKPLAYAKNAKITILKYYNGELWVIINGKEYFIEENIKEVLEKKHEKNSKTNKR